MTENYQPTLQELRDAVAMMKKPLWSSEFDRKIRLAKNGDIIEICHHSPNYYSSQESWWPHQEGVVVLKHSNTDYDFVDCVEMRLNNEDLLKRFGGILAPVCLHPRGIIQYKLGHFGVKAAYQYFLNDGNDVLEIASTDYGLLNIQCNPQGLLFEKDKKILLNGEEIYNLSPEDAEWRAHPQGFAVRRERKIFLNGQDLIYEGNVSPSTKRRNRGVLHWEACCPQGIITRNYGARPNWFLNDQKIPLPKKEYAFPGVEKNSVSLNKNGIYFRGQDNNIYFLVWRQGSQKS